MKDQEIIKKLQLLKTIQPDKHALKVIKEGVYQQIQSENKAPTYFSIQEMFSAFSALIKSYGIVFYTGTTAFLVIIFLSALILFFPNKTHNIIIFGRLAFAPNQYEKARIVLGDTKSRFANNRIAQTNATELAYSLALTNTQLNGLKLKGEKGKYTAQECHQIYQEYLNYLESKEKAIPPHNTALKSEISSYEEQAERKLHLYNSL